MLNDDRHLLDLIADGDVKSLGILYVLYAARIRNFDTSELLKNIDYALAEMSVLRYPAHFPNLENYYNNTDKMKRSFLIFAAAVIGFVSCGNKEP